MEEPEKSQSLSKFRTFAALLFGGAALLSVGFFEIRSQSLSSFGAIALVAYFVFVASTSLLAMSFSRWYMSESGLFETLAVPAIVALVSALVAACSFALADRFLPEQTTGLLPTAGEIVGFSVYGGALFLAHASPVLVPALLLASVLLSRRSKNVQAPSAA